MIALTLLCKGVLLEGVHQLSLRKKRRAGTSPKHTAELGAVVDAIPNADKSVWSIK